MPKRYRAPAERFRAPYELDGRMKSMLFREARRHLWRVTPLYDFDDLLQEGMLCYCICRNKYPHAENAAHFMRLLRTVFMNQINDLATRRTRSRSIIAELRVEQDETDMSITADPDVALFVKQLPRDLQKLVGALASGRTRGPRRYRELERETNNQKLCRHAGVNPNRNPDIEGDLHNHLLGQA